MTDAIRVLGRPVISGRKPEYSENTQNILGIANLNPSERISEGSTGSGLHLSAGGRQLSVPLTPEYIDVAITLLSALKGELKSTQEIIEESEILLDDEDLGVRVGGTVPANVAGLELGSMEQLDLSGEA